MIDHVSLRVSDLARAVEFYRAALAPLGYEVIMEFPDTVGMGEQGKPDLWITRCEQAINPIHLALSASRDAVEAFHAAALAAGGTDNGAPGPRPEYHPHYFGAFVRDPEGNNVEAVCHADPAAASPTKAARRPKAKSAARSKPAVKAKGKPAPKGKPAAKAKGKPAAKAKGKPAAKAKGKPAAKAKGKPGPRRGR
jgi:catechol 2,3-dioxygenase-like lactoylglutathione lyase family enzyme